MRHGIILLFILCAAVFAQPHEGPWTIAEATDGMEYSDLFVISRADSLADVFFVESSATHSAVKHIVYSFTERAAHPQTDVVPLVEGTLEIQAAYPDGAEGWYLVVFHQPSSSPENATRLYYNNQNDLMYQGYWTGQFTYGSTRFIDTHIAPRIGGGVMLVGGAYMTWGYEFDVTPVVLAAASGSPTIELISDPQLYSTWYWDVVSFDHDSAFLLADQAYSWDVVWLYELPQAIQHPDSMRRIPLTPPLRPDGLGLTRGGTMLGINYEEWDDDPFMLYQIARDGTGTIRGQIEIPAQISDPQVFFHPDYGFAAMFVTSGSLELARVDTIGAAVQSFGAIFERDAQHWITGGNVTVANDGRVIATWGEREDGSFDATRIRMASVGWTSELDASEPFSPQPLSFSLSAYPNPFNSTLHIEYQLPYAENVTLSVFNVLGQHVETLLDGFAQCGTHHAIWTPRSAGGLYFIQLKSATDIQTQKILYLK